MYRGFLWPRGFRPESSAKSIAAFQIATISGVGIVLKSAVGVTLKPYDFADTTAALRPNSGIMQLLHVTTDYCTEYTAEVYTTWDMRNSCTTFETCNIYKWTVYNRGPGAMATLGHTAPTRAHPSFATVNC